MRSSARSNLLIRQLSYLLIKQPFSLGLQIVRVPQYRAWGISRGKLPSYKIGSPFLSEQISCTTECLSAGNEFNEKLHTNSPSNPICIMQIKIQRRFLKSRREGGLVMVVVIYRVSKRIPRCRNLSWHA